MTLQQLDDVLKTWQGRLSAMAENLLELQLEANYRSLTGEGGFARVALSGATAARVGPAIGSVHRLFACFGALQSTIDQATALRRELPAFFGGEAKAREIQRLLFSPSVQLEDEATPLADRGLLAADSAPHRYTPEQVMASMAARFAEVRDAVDTASQAWSAYGEAVERLETELLRLRAQTAMPAARLASALDGVQAQLEMNGAGAQTDPLGASQQLQQQIEPALARVGAQIATGEGLAAQLRAAQARYERLRSSQAELQHLLQRHEAVITPAAPEILAARVAEPTMESLLQWHRRLESKRDEGAFEAVVVGLRNWDAAVDKLLQASREAVSRCERELALRDELRGRLRALKAKARAQGSSSVSQVRSLGAEAEQLVLSEPLALAAAVAALTRFEDQLRRNAVAAPQGSVLP